MNPLFRSLADALSLVSDGDRIAITKLNPAGALLALAGSGRRDLHLVGIPTAGFGADILAAAGAISRIEAGALVMGNYGTARNVVRGVESGEIALVDSSCPLLELQFIAGMSGLSFTPVPGFSGSDILKRRPDIRSMEDPYDPEHDVLIAPAINPDVAIVHGLRADPDGNVVVSALNEDRLVVKAARRAIATVEAVSDDALASLSPEEEVVPEMYFDAISVLPGGAKPFACPGCYDDDVAGISAWITASRDEEAMRGHLAALIGELAA